MLAVTACMALALLGACGTDKRRLADLASENVLVRNTAIEQLGAERAREAVPRLIELAATNALPASRLLSIRALGSIGDTNAVHVLIPALGDADVAIALAAVEALGKLRDSRAVPALTDRLTDTNLQAAAIWALGSIEDSSAVAALTPLLSSPDRFLSYHASQALKRIGGGR